MLCRQAGHALERRKRAELGDDDRLLNTAGFPRPGFALTLVELAPDVVRRGDLLVLLVDRGEHRGDVGDAEDM